MDLVRLAIVYETQQAAARVDDLNTRTARLDKTLVRVNQSTQVTTTRLRGVALAGLRLSHGLAAGNLSAIGLATSLSRFAGAGIAGAVIISIVNIVNALKEFQRISRDVETTIDSTQNTARDARKDVARLLLEIPEETPAEKAVKRLRDAVASMRKEAERIGGAAGKVISGQADALEREIGAVGARAARLPARQAARALQDYNREVIRTDRLLSLLGATEREKMEAAIALERKRLETLDLSSEQAQQLAASIRTTSERMAQMDRQANRLAGVLYTATDAIEDFVVTGTFAFEDFLNNILRLLYRDFTQDLVTGIIRSAYPTATSAPGGSGGVEVLGTPRATGGPSGSVNMNVNFSVQAIDAQGTAQFFERNGALIAGEVAKAATKSRAVRRAFQRG